MRISNNLNNLKTVMSISVTRNAPGRPDYGKGRIMERWEKVVKNDGKYFN